MKPWFRQKRVRIQGISPQLTIVKPDGTLKIILAKEHIRLLGANLNRDATWAHQLELGEKPVLKTLRSTIGALTHISKNMNVKCRLLLANGLFISKLLYLLPMWGGLTYRDSKKIQVLLNKCARMVLGKKRKTRTRELMTSCGWLYYKELVDYHSLVQLFKIINLGTPKNLKDSFKILDNKRIDIFSSSSRQIQKNPFPGERPQYGMNFQIT